MVPHMIAKRDPIPELISFVKSWVGDINSTHRIPKSQIPRSIPTPLREIYHQFGGYPPKKGRKPEAKYGVPLFSTQDYLIPLDRLRISNGQIAFIAENQGVFSCTTVPNETDPPVWVDWPDESVYQICELRLSKFLTTFCLQEVALSSPLLATIDTPVGNVRDALTRRPKVLWRSKYIDDEVDYAFHICDGRLLLFQMGALLWACSTDDNYLELIKPGIAITDMSIPPHKSAFPVT